jgi:hypothetical protein
MSDYYTVSETDVLIATALFLRRTRGIYPYQLSIPRGKGIDVDSAKKLISDTFNPEDVYPVFSNEGPDIKGISECEWWLIECKGAGKGAKQTQRNNFDRALASVVLIMRGKYLRKMRKKGGIILWLPQTGHLLPDRA